LSLAIDVVFKVKLRSLVAVRQPQTLRATNSRALAAGRREGPALDFARVNFQFDTANVQVEAQRRDKEGQTVMGEGARVGCIGDLLVEFVCTTRNGRHKRAGTYSGPYPSGAAGIFIDQAAQVGGRCIFVGAVGDDAFGEVVLRRLVDHGVTPQLIRVVPGVPTGTAFVSYNDDGSRDFVYNIVLSAAARFDGDDATIAALDAFGLDVMHVSGSALSDEGMCAKVLRVCKALHAKGTTISFDPNVRKELIGNPAYFAAVGEMVDMTGIFLPSEDDAATLFPGRDLDGVAAELFVKGARCVVLKKGDKGCEGLTRDGERADFAAHDVQVLDPTGAGDCFCATFVTLYAAGAYSFGEATRRANAAGALAVTKVGPMEGNSDLTAIEALLKRDA
jgi:sugar/nucleoside kinase (ribokinase family)